jgi:aerobic-type carbon monoxide dehydrogenase small subunit (CoxS/CutS family)
VSGKVKVRFRLNGASRADEIEPNQTLCDYLHDSMGATSVKKGCDTGECGACTVLLDDMPVTSCLVLAPQVDGREVVTAEGLGTKSNPHPVHPFGLRRVIESMQPPSQHSFSTTASRFASFELIVWVR